MATTLWFSDATPVVAKAGDPAVSVSAPASSGNEASAGTLTFTLTAASAISANVTLSYSGATRGTSCSSGVDFIAPDSVTFSNHTSRTFSMTICDDSVEESNETITVAVTARGNDDYTAGSSATFTINNDDVPPTTTTAPTTTVPATTTTTTTSTTTTTTTLPAALVISLDASATSVNEGNATGNTVTFTVKANRSVASATKVNVDGLGGTCSGSSVAKFDNVSGGSVTIPNGSSQVTFTATTCPNTTFAAADASYTVTISKPNNESYQLGAATSRTVSVLADDLSASPITGTVDKAGIFDVDITGKVQVPTGATVTVSHNWAGSEGSVAPNSNRPLDLVFTPNNTLIQSTSAAFTYTITDSRTGATSSSSVSISITAIPPCEIPDASDASASVDYGKSVTVTPNLSGANVCVDGWSLQISSSNQPSEGSASVSGKSIAYTHSGNGNAVADSFKYDVLVDGEVQSSAVITLNIPETSKGVIQMRDVNDSLILEPSNDPKVCEPVVEGWNLAPNSQYTLTLFANWSGNQEITVFTETVTTNANGTFTRNVTEDTNKDLSYKATLMRVGGISISSKVFTRTCPPPAEVTIEDASRYEGDDGVSQMEFKVSASGNQQRTITVQATVSDRTSGEGNAVGGSTCAVGVDFIEPSNPIAITLVGNKPETLSVAICGDTEFEPDEMFDVTLAEDTSSPLQFTLKDGQATGTIQNDPIVPMIEDNEIKEEHDGSQVLSFDVSANEEADVDARVTITTDAEGAVEFATECSDGVDFAAATDIVTITDGVGEFTVDVCGDTEYEDDETFDLSIALAGDDVSTTDHSNDGGDDESPTDTAVGTILDDDTVVTIGVETGDNTIPENNLGENDSRIETTLTFPVTADPAVTTSAVATFEDDTATMGDDCSGDADFYVPNLVEGELSVDIDTGVGSIAVTVCGDKDIEDDEMFDITLTRVDGDEWGFDDVSATGTIIDDDSPVVFTVNGDGLDDDAQSIELFNAPSMDGMSDDTCFTVNLENVSNDNGIEVTLSMAGVINDNEDDIDVTESIHNGNSCSDAALNLGDTIVLDSGESKTMAVSMSAAHRSQVHQQTGTMKLTATVERGGAKTKKSTTLTLDIQRKLVVNANDKSRRYDTTVPLDSSYVGLLSADDIVAFRQSLRDGFTCTSATTRLSNVGTYPSAIGCAERTNAAHSTVKRKYNVIERNPATMSITPLPVTIRGNSYTRLEGQPNPTLAYTVTGTSATNITGVTCTSAGTNARPGDYDVTCSGSGTTSPNFLITYVPGRLTVEPNPTTTTSAPPTTVAAVTTAPPTTAAPTSAPATTQPALAPAPTTTSTTTTLPGGGVVVETASTPDGEEEEEVIETTDNDDIVDVKEGDKEINTGGGDDKVSGGSGGETVNGGQGSDRIDTGDGDDVIDGGEGDDELVSFQGNNTITGGPGNDKIVSGTAAGGEISGGPGDDTFYKFVEREFDIDDNTVLTDIENIVVVLFDCSELPDYESLGTEDLLDALNLESNIVPAITIQCRENPLSTPGLDQNGNEVGLPLMLSDIFNGPQSDEYYMNKSFEEMVNIAWARVESQRPRFSNWIRQNGVDGVQTYCARTPFPCEPIKES